MLSVQDRINVVLLMAKHESVTTARREWQRNFTSKPPSESTFRLVFKKFTETGSVQDAERSGRPSLDEDDVLRVKEEFENNPRSSVRDAANQLDMPRETVRRTLKRTIGMKSFHISRVHELLPDDYEPRLQFCEEISRLCDDPSFIHKLCFSDEAIFHLNGKINSHNCVIWDYENPHLCDEIPLKSKGLVVWAAMFCDRIIGPYFFETTVTKDSYLEMLRDYFIPELKRLRRFSTAVFQQDGAPPHWGLNVREFLNIQFPNRWIGRNGPIHWPARSPDLTPLDYFLWGHIKEMVYKNRPTDNEELRVKIAEAVQSVTKVTINKTFENFQKRVILCNEVNGAHFQHIL